MEASWLYWLIPIATLFLLSIPVLDALVQSRWSVSVTCPAGKGQVEATFVGPESLGISTAVDVCDCSAVPDMRAAACGKGCLRLSIAKTGPTLSEPSAV